MSAEEHGRCIDCGEHTPLRLPRRFPHICTACLFPPPRNDDPDLPLDSVDGIVRPSLIETLHARVSRVAKFERPFGHRAVDDWRNRPE